MIYVQGTIYVGKISNIMTQWQRFVQSESTHDYSHYRENNYFFLNNAVNSKSKYTTDLIRRTKTSHWGAVLIKKWGTPET